MPEIICEECGKRLFHENPTTLDVEKKIHLKFCRKSVGQSHSYMHKDNLHSSPFDPERQADNKGRPILKK